MAAALTWAQADGASAGSPRQMRRGKLYAKSVTDSKLHGKTVATLELVAGPGDA